MGKKKVLSEEVIKDMILPAACARAWDFQSDKRGDVIWRYTRAQSEWLRKKGYLTIERGG